MRGEGAARGMRGVCAAVVRAARLGRVQELLRERLPGGIGATLLRRLREAEERRREARGRDGSLDPPPDTLRSSADIPRTILRPTPTASAVESLNPRAKVEHDGLSAAALLSIGGAEGGADVRSQSLLSLQLSREAFEDALREATHTVIIFRSKNPGQFTAGRRGRWAHEILQRIVRGAGDELRHWRRTRIELRALALVLWEETRKARASSQQLVDRLESLGAPPDTLHRARSLQASSESLFLRLARAALLKAAYSLAMRATQAAHRTRRQIRGKLLRLRKPAGLLGDAATLWFEVERILFRIVRIWKAVARAEADAFRSLAFSAFREGEQPDIASHGFPSVFSIVSGGDR